MWFFFYMTLFNLLLDKSDGDKRVQVIWFIFLVFLLSLSGSWLSKGDSSLRIWTLNEAKYGLLTNASDDLPIAYLCCVTISNAITLINIVIIFSIIYFHYHYQSFSFSLSLLIIFIFIIITNHFHDLLSIIFIFILINIIITILISIISSGVIISIMIVVI